MKQLFVDLETYYDDTYSLRKMTPIEYVLNPRFEALGCAFAKQDEEPFWVDGPDLGKFFNELDLTDTRVVSHNAAFDCLILAFLYGVKPPAYGCTLSMARNWISHQIGKVSLASCAKRYGLDAKMDTLSRTKGVNFEALRKDPPLHAEVEEYAIDDVSKCRSLYNIMLQEGFPETELEVIDWVVKMVALPQFEIDTMLVAEHLNDVLIHKQLLLDTAQLENRDNLMRDDALAGLLTMLGVDPVPRKVSKNTGQEQWAFAKTDRAFTALLEHPDPSVQAIVAARLGHKSTLEQSRAERFTAIANLTKAFPVPLKYSGAHTHRFSGDWSLNLQNLPNGSRLRKALKAPAGHVVVSIDASQIEARLNATLSGESWLVDSFAKGRDVYCDFASALYNRTILKQLDKTERFVGKTAILSLGYGSSWLTFQAMCRNKGQVTLTDQVADMAVNLYRARCPCIVEHWRAADRGVLPMIAAGKKFQWGALEVRQDALLLPNGNSLRYQGLAWGYDEVKQRKQWTYKRGALTQNIYGAKLVENECQSLAFVHIAEVARRVMKLTEGLLWPAHQIHDELVYVVPEHLAEQVKTLVIAEMSRPPDWLPHAPLAAEGKIGPSYGDMH